PRQKRVEDARKRANGRSSILDKIANTNRVPSKRSRPLSGPSRASPQSLSNCNEFAAVAIRGVLDRGYRAVLCRSAEEGPQRPANGKGKSMADNVVRVCAQSEITPETVKAYEVGDKRLAVYNLAGQFSVTDDKCTHASASLADGFLEDGIIECSLHSGAFDVKTGAVKSPPCSFALRTYKVVLQGDDVFVDLDKDAAGEPA